MLKDALKILSRQTRDHYIYNETNTFTSICLF